MNGIDVIAGTGNAFVGNTIYSNRLLGINLGTAGVTANDSGDGDTGANNLQNFPVLFVASSTGGTTRISGSLNSTASTPFRIEFFSSATGDASGYGEGQTYLGATTVTTDAIGNASFSAVLTGVTVATGHAVTATATVDLGAGNYGNTSEFAANLLANNSAQVVAGQDTYIKLSNTGLNYGASTSLLIDRESTDLQRALLQFDLSAIPTNATITSATLTMQATQIDGQLNISVYEMLRAWVEGSGSGAAGAANWNQSAPGTNWTSAGGDFNATAVANLNTNTTGQHSWSITSLVQAWVNGSKTNYGLMVASPDGGGNRTATYDSSEGATPPKLVISYTVPLPPVNTLPGPQTTRGDTPLVLSGASAISVADPDSASLQVSLLSAGGVMSLSGTAGLTFSLGDGTADAGMTFSGTIANLNAALNGLVFTPDSGFSGDAGITVTTSDGTTTTVGRTTIAPTVSAQYDKQQIATQVNFAAAGTVTNLNVYLQNVKANTGVYVGLYTDSGGEPGTLLAQASRDLSIGSGWYAFDIPDVSVSAGNYWLAFGPQKEGRFYYSTTGGNSRVSNYDPVTGLAPTWTGTTQSNSWSISAYATFLPSGQNGLSDTDALIVTVQTAPTLDVAKNPVLSAINEDAGAPVGAVGTLVSALVDFANPAGQVDNVTDVDSGALLGIAVTAADTANGSWWYSTNGGTNWIALGAVANNNARLLAADANTRLYFQPNANYNGTLATAITFRAWDTTSGSNGAFADTSSNGGTTAFSTATDTASLTITAVNDAPTFTSGAGTGKVTTAVSSVGDAAVATLVQPDGKIVVLGSNGSTGKPYLARYNADGTLDAGFGTGGISSLSFSVYVDAPSALARQSDGKLLIAGTTNSSDFFVARLNADGTLDTTFDGDGVAWIDFAGGSDTARGIAVQSDGKIVVAGVATLAGNSDFALARLNSNGSLDTSFDTDGKVTTAIGAGSDEANGLAIQADGRIVLAGFSDNGSNWDVALVRYNANGSLDTSFDGDGKRTLALGTGYDRANAVAVQSDGKIVVGGDAMIAGSPDFAVMRFNSDGSLDTSFDTDGIVTTEVSSQDYAPAMVLQADGKIVLAGFAFAGMNDFALVRYNSNGSLDTTFDGDGKVLTAIGAATDEAYAVAVQADGKIVAAGYGTFASVDTALVRYNTNGSLDTSFGATSTLNGTPTFVENGLAVVLDSNVTIIDPELSASNNFSGATLTLVRSGGASSQDVFSATGTLSSISSASGNLVVGATTIGTYTNAGGTLVLTFNANATNALVNSAMQQIAYANSSDAPPASVQINWTFNDGNSGSQGSGGPLSVTGSTTVTITAVNDAPVLDGSPVLSLNPVNEDSGAPVGAVGTLVSELVDLAGGSGRDNVTDADAGALTGIAVTQADAGAGTWYYSTDNGANWNLLPAVSSSNALLLAADGGARIYFRPTADFSGLWANSLQFRAWDQTSGSNGGFGNTTANGGSTAFSSTIEYVSAPVSAVNDAPVLDNSGAMTLTTITEDQTTNAGNTVAEVIASAGGDRIIDPDATALEGIALTGLASGNGTWQYSIDGGTNWFAVGTVSDSSALLLRATDKLRFVPDAKNADSASVTFRAWDRTGSGNAGDKVNASINGGTTAFSTATESAAIIVTAVNDAPSLATSTAFPAISEEDVSNSGTLVSSFATSVTDVDAGAVKGLTISSVDNSHGTWQYTLDGTNWLDIGNVSTSSARLLPSDATARIRFVPSPDWNGFTGLMYYGAWDQTSGTAGGLADITVTGGTTAFGTAGGSGSGMTVNAVNDAPTALSTSVSLAAVLEDTANPPGATVTTLFAATFSDAKDQVTGGSSANNFAGVAIVANTANAGSEGVWQWYNGTSWTSVSTSVSTSSALTLAPSTLVRFLPNANYNGTPGTLTVRLIDDSSGAVTPGATVNVGTGGGTAQYSSAGNAVTLGTSITAVNDPPVNTVPGGQTTPEDTAKVFSAGNGNAISISDADAGASAMQVTLTATNGSITLSGIAGLIFTTGTGTDDATMTFTGTIADINTALNGLSFAPTTNFNGVANLQIVPSDQGNTGTGGTLTDTDNIAITVTAVSDPPRIDDVSVSLAEGAANGSAVTDLNEYFTGTDLDPDGQALTYSITGGNTGATFAINSATGVITVANNALLVFATHPVFTLTVQASDGSLTDTAAVEINLINTPAGGGIGSFAATQENRLYSISFDTGQATLLATSPYVTPGQGINSLGFDQVKGIFYYASGQSTTQTRRSMGSMRAPEPTSFSRTM